ncbi:hypothetical protein JOQ06_012973 [Pogonophryne albipinna]|uniref:Suppressor of cytokine signaling 7 n=1 Tax=Pogonophryne albipinna TaxID=1090488 RepID=A0AAD6BIQ3_9TELE|nr:hypothetical protein JOQ06_012973 [Pogonophryne albipinna]
MNNAQDMSPDFVLMRLVSAAEDDRLDAENGNLPPGGVSVAGLGKDVLAHSGVKPGLDISRDPTVGLDHPNKGHPPHGETAPDTGGTESRVPAPAPPQSPMEAQGFDFAPSPGLRPQLLVFSNIMRNGEGILELDRRNQQRDALGLDQSAGPAVNNNSRSTGDAQQQDLMDRTWGAHPPGEMHQGAAELCRRHRLITTTPEWPLLSERSNPLTVIDSKWGCASRDREGAVFELARRFGELGVGAVPKMLLKAGELPQCSCQGAHRPAGGGVEPRDDPTETSDALLVLEGLGSGDVGLDMDECTEGDPDDEVGRREFLLNRKREIVQKMSGSFSISSFQAELRRQVEGSEAASAHLHGSQVCSLHGGLARRISQVSSGDSEVAAQVSATTPLSTPTPVQNSPWGTSPNLSQVSTPRRRPERCASAPRTPTSGWGSGGEKMLKVPGKSKKGSLKIRLSKLFRTKSCSGSNHLLDKRSSVTYSVSSAGSLVDMASSPGAEPDSHSQPRLTRAHKQTVTNSDIGSLSSRAPENMVSHIAPKSLNFTISEYALHGANQQLARNIKAATFHDIGESETVSLVDVDISRRGVNTPHPPTPPPPPRRSLSLLGTFIHFLSVSSSVS